MKPKKLTSNEFVIVKRISLSDDGDYEKLEKEVSYLFFSNLKVGKSIEIETSKGSKLFQLVQR